MKMPKCRDLKFELPSDSLEGVESLDKVVLKIGKEELVSDPKTEGSVPNVYRASFELVHPYEEYKAPTYKERIIPMGNGAGFGRDVSASLTQRNHMDVETARAWTTDFLRTRVSRYLGENFETVEPSLVYENNGADRKKGALRVTGTVYMLDELCLVSHSLEMGTGKLDDFLLKPE